jgi:subtilisin-like proprotein convertase family protein
MALQLAETWKPLPETLNQSSHRSLIIETPVVFIEFVLLKVTVENITGARILLTSPSGTRRTVLYPSQLEDGWGGRRQQLVIRSFFGEDANGRWQLAFESLFAAEEPSFEISFYGSAAPLRIPQPSREEVRKSVVPRQPISLSLPAEIACGENVSISDSDHVAVLLSSSRWNGRVPLGRPPMVRLPCIFKDGVRVAFELERENAVASQSETFTLLNPDTSSQISGALTKSFPPEFTIEYAKQLDDYPSSPYFRKCVVGVGTYEKRRIVRRLFFGDHNGSMTIVLPLGTDMRTMNVSVGFLNEMSGGGSWVVVAKQGAATGPQYLQLVGTALLMVFGTISFLWVNRLAPGEKADKDRLD